jgi:hypothetical protein
VYDVDHAANPGAADLAEGFEVVFTDEEGEHQLPLSDVGSVPFEACRPVRSFPSYKGQRHHSGRWWTATTGTLVGYESWLERDTLIVLDFDADIVGIASKPFWLHWTTRDGTPRSHAPDYFARLANGSVRLLDVQAPEWFTPRDQAAFDTTGLACEQLGWDYEVVGPVPEVKLANLRWLAGYRHPRHDLAETARHLRALFSRPHALMAGARVVGSPRAVLPVLFHLLWTQQLRTDLTIPLGPDAMVTTVAWPAEADQ